MIIQKVGIINLLTKKQFFNKKSVMPIVALPLVAYISTQESNTTDLRNFFLRKNLTWPSYVNPHPDTKKGICYADKRKVKEALERALKKKQISQDEFDTYSKKIPFTGKEDEVYYDTDDDYLSEVEDFKETLPCNTELSTELKDVLKSPSFSSARGLMSSILGEDLVNKFEADLDEAWDSMSHIKQMTLDILGFGD